MIVGRKLSLKIVYISCTASLTSEDECSKGEEVRTRMSLIGSIKKSLGLKVEILKLRVLKT